jgi:hypothetical protein
LRRFALLLSRLAPVSLLASAGPALTACAALPPLRIGKAAQGACDGHQKVMQGVIVSIKVKIWKPASPRKPLAHSRRKHDLT